MTLRAGGAWTVHVAHWDAYSTSPPPAASGRGCLTGRTRCALACRLSRCRAARRKPSRSPIVWVCVTCVGIAGMKVPAGVFVVRVEITVQSGRLLVTNNGVARTSHLGAGVGPSRFSTRPPRVATSTWRARQKKPPCPRERPALRTPVREMRRRVAAGRARPHGSSQAVRASDAPQAAHAT